MSKDKPEVGDIWGNKKDRTAIFITHNFVFYRDILGINEQGKGIFIPADIFFNEWVFVCKSKCKIEDLFKTENE